MLRPEDGFSEQRADAPNPQWFQGRLTLALTPQCFTPAPDERIAGPSTRKKFVHAHWRVICPHQNNFAANLFHKPVPLSIGSVEALRPQRAEVRRR